jgi:hypothetical protein
MKNQLITIVATIVLLPITAFTQTAPAPPAPPVPPMPPQGPGGPPDHHEKKVPVTFLGVETSDVPSVVCEQLGLAKGFGLVVDYIVPDSPAAAGGVQQNDIIKMLNDQILTEPEQLAKLIRSFPEGTTVTLTVLRKGKEEKLTVKLTKKDVSERGPFGPGRHQHSHSGFNYNFNMGDFGMSDLKEQMDDLKEQLGDQKRGMIHDAIAKAHEEANRAREQAMRARDDARRQRGRFNVTTNDNGTIKTTNIDMDKAQIVFSDDKGELRVEKIDGKKVLTAKNPQGLLLFSGPVETKEDLDKVPAEVRQRYENLEQKELPSAISSGQRDEDSDADDVDEDNDEDSGATSTQQVSAHGFGGELLRL